MNDKSKLKYFILYSHCTWDLTHLKMFLLTLTFKSLSTPNHLYLKEIQNKTESKWEFCSELCSDSTDAIKVGGCVCQKLHLRSPRRDTALFCGFGKLQIQNKYLPGMGCRMTVGVLSCLILVPSKLNNGCNFFNLLC